MNTIQRQYLKDQEKCGFKPGDQVRITREAKYRERGWGTGWVSSMDRMIGRIGTIQNVGEECTGVLVEDPDCPANTCWYPWFSLEKI